MHATMAALRRNFWLIRLGGYYTLTLGFEGNIGAEIPCITINGLSVTESAVLSPIEIGPTRIR
jgi:hypothetical protein